jgi:hypothetical protein
MQLIQDFTHSKLSSSYDAMPAGGQAQEKLSW